MTTAGVLGYYLGSCRNLPNDSASVSHDRTSWIGAVCEGILWSFAQGRCLAEPAKWQRMLCLIC
jgi:hypothetical protein